MNDAPNTDAPNFTIAPGDLHNVAAGELIVDIAGQRTTTSSTPTPKS